VGWVRKLAIGAVLAAALAIGGTLPQTAPAGGFSYLQMAPIGGIALAGSPYRWQTFTLGREHRVTVVERVDRRGGLVSRRWHLNGAWHLGAPAYDGSGTGLAGDESVLVMTRFDRAPRGLRLHTHLAILDAGPHRLHGPSPVRRVTLPGDYGVYAISLDGSTLFLVHTRSLPPSEPRFTIRPYDLRRHRLLPPAAIHDNGEILRGVATTRIQDGSGHRVYTLYSEWEGRESRTYLLALDTFGRTLRRVELPRLHDWKNPMLLRLRLDAAEHQLTIETPTGTYGDRRWHAVVRIDLRELLPPPRPRRASIPAPVGVFAHVVGHSLRGRPIELLEVGDLSLPGGLLVFGCIHGDECGASALEPLRNGCPDPHLHAFVVPNLDPDGSAVKSRLNAHGVDLNRNFASGWRPIGALRDAEYAGPRPFSEPETRLAARLIRRIQPQVTIWFHQDWGDGAYVRAWGQSVPAARRFARLAGIGFRLLRWPAGTAPNWQNHRFPGTSSFVVETPRGSLGESLRTRLTAALSSLGEELGEDPGVPRKG
jgi:murein peptide amidase A